MERLVKDTQQLLLNNHETTLFYEMKSALQQCLSFQFNVAFVTFGGVQLFADVFNKLEKDGVIGKIITSTYLTFSEPKAIRKLNSFNNIELKLHYGDKQGLHAKAYIFEFEESFKVIIGSSNLTEKALKSNIEWNVMTITKKGQPFFDSVQEEYEDIWNRLDPFEESRFKKYIDQYNSNREQRKQYNHTITLPTQANFTITQNSMQKEAIENLDFIRKQDGKRALVVAATGTGKTYMSAFDVKNVQPKKVLFVVHRENIIDAAIVSFKDVLGKQIYYNKYLGTLKDKEADYIFTTNLTISKDLYSFDRNHFDYIIIDEAHHASASTYQQIINYFTPKFLLGMTATPERMDDGNIFEIFDYNVGIEVRLDKAINSNLVVPFHYFGITDIEDVDLSDVDIDNIAEVSKRLQVNKRTDFILEKMELFGYDGEKLKCIGFCVDINHAKYMSDSFNAREIESIAITGLTDVAKRKEYFDRLEDEKDDLKVIFAVDVLNEGIDIPSVNQVLMLRPTNSPTIFIQQIGRGLRKFEDKKYLTILDFIGNHNRSFLVSIALHGERYANKDSIKIDVKQDFSLSPRNVFIQMDEISKERIIEQLNQTNFNQLKYLKQDYSEFKASRNGRIPYKLMDYFVQEGAPDPLKFAKYDKKSYLLFLKRMERDNPVVERLNQDKLLFKVTQSLHEFLPLVRPHEFLILRYLMGHDEVNFEELNKQIQDLTGGNQTENTSHALKVLNHERYDSSQISRLIQMIIVEGDDIKLSSQIKSIIENLEKYKIVEDIINYGLKRYFDSFGKEDYGYPFLKRYSEYTMQEVGMLANIENKLSSFRGQGVLSYGKNYFLFVDLHKDEDIKDSINYNDKFIDYSTFQWESQNNTSQESRVGKRFINHKEQGYHLHLFVRKMSEIDGSSLPYLYLGKVDVQSYQNNKPIEFIFKLRNNVPYEIYNDLTYKVD